jgi:hypothetical protein
VLVFVYNADSGRLNTLLDTAHKLLSPATYNCRLCQLSYDTFHENRLWQDFRQSLAEDVIFLHRDEFFSRYYHYDEKILQLPALFRDESGKLSELLSAATINRASDTCELIGLCRSVIDGS